MEQRSDTLERLADSGLRLADGEVDIRDRHVFDVDGEKIGHVSGLFVDPGEAKVRFLEVSGGGILGLGDTQILVPVEAVTRMEDEGVHLDQGRAKVAGGPKYQPDLVEDEGMWDGAYAAYGYAPYWIAPGYMFPPPYFPRRY